MASAAKFRASVLTDHLTPAMTTNQEVDASVDDTVFSSQSSILERAPDASSLFAIHHHGNGVVEVELRRVRAHNALSLEMIVYLQQRLLEWEVDGRVLAVVLRGAGEKAFSSGGDIKQFVAPRSWFDAHEFTLHEYRMDNHVFRFTKPLISLMHGYVMGGGAGLGLACRYRVVTDRVLFSMPECSVGYFADVGSSHFLSRCRPPQAGTWMALTAARVGAHDMLATGLATHFVKHTRAGALVARLTSTPLGDDADAAVRALLDALPPVPAHGGGDSVVRTHSAVMEHCFGAASVGEIVARLERDGGAWARAQLAALRRMAPTSVHVNLELLRRAAQCDKEGCLRMEFRLSRRMLREAWHGDLHEGVRCLLVEKGTRPRWRVGRLEDVRRERVLAYFEGMEDGIELDFAM